ncbi:hypothetical protein ACL9RL_09415 [Plantibacter sp. Mn2098]|uniref:hypothetical protein n=1 Tax=Plantibacter sp. Mn2098 TaxID=3395266 RepID=UPI003BEAE189
MTDALTKNAPTTAPTVSGPVPNSNNQEGIDMSITTVPQTTVNRQKFEAAITAASAPAAYGSERWQAAFAHMQKLVPDLEVLSPGAAGEIYNDIAGPEVEVWNGKAPAWANAKDSDCSSSVTTLGDPVAHWSSENLIGYDNVDAFIVRDDEYSVDTDTIHEGPVYLRVYVGAHDPINLTSAAEALTVHSALSDSARRFDEILNPRPTFSDDVSDDDFVKLEGITEDEAWARGNEVLPSVYPGAFAMRIDGACQDIPANLYHQIDVHKSDTARIELVKPAGKPWRIEAVLKDGSRTVNELSEYADWLAEAVKRASKFNIVDGFTGEGNVA